MEKTLLSGGMGIPKLGLGTFNIKEENMRPAITASIEAGIRLFDTAPNYHVDVALGQALRQTGLRREEVMIVEKVDTLQQLHPIRRALEGCLDRLKTDYIDLYLMHWPFPGRYVDTWLQMEQLFREGLVRSIGVCNFMPHHLAPLLTKANMVPTVNQIEMHPLFTQKETVDYCRKRGISIMSYTPLGRMAPALINSPLLASLAQKYSKTVPQIILRWNVQSGFIVIPKSDSPRRIRENSEIFDFSLSGTEMTGINALDCGMRLRFDPDDLRRYPLGRFHRLWLRMRAWTVNRMNK